MTKKTVIPVMGFALAMLIGCTDGGAYPPSGSISGSASTVTPYVQDLVGARGRDGEGRLEERGFVWVKTEKSDSSSYTYWKHSQSGQCISVRTTDGRYASLVKTSPFDCEKR